MASTRHNPQFDFKSDESHLQMGGPKPHRTSKNYDKRIIILLIISPIFILLFTSIPVIVKFHGIGADIYRFFEPVVSLPLQYYILITSEVFIDKTQEGRNFIFLTEKSFLNVWFLIGAALYAQGAGMHSTAIIAKHSIEDLISAHPEIVQQYPAINDVLNYFQETLEHTIGHYMYATGFAIMTLAQLFAYRRQKHDGIDSLKNTLWWIIGGILLGLLYGAVGIEFPDGPLVILIYASIVSLVLVIYLIRSKILFTKGKRLVLQSYLIGYITAIIILLIWIIAVGGIKNRKAAGLFH